MGAEPLAIGPDGTVSMSTMADILDLSYQRIRDLTKEGVIKGEKVNGRYRFDLRAGVRGYLAFLRTKPKQTATDSKTLEKQRLEEDVRLKRAKAEQAELELDELRGNLHRSSDVEEAINGLVYAARSDLTALPGRVAMDAFGAKTAAEVSQIVKREVNQIMDDLAHYEYDPSLFAERVRERQGWSEPDESQPDS